MLCQTAKQSDKLRVFFLIFCVDRTNVLHEFFEVGFSVFFNITFHKLSSLLLKSG